MKTIQELITEGMEIKKSCTSVAIIPIVSGEVYEGWLTYCERLLNHQFPDDPQTIEFSEISRRANGNDAKLLDRLIGILKAFLDIPPVSSRQHSLEHNLQDEHHQRKGGVSLEVNLGHHIHR